MIHSFFEIISRKIADWINWSYFIFDFIYLDKFMMMNWLSKRRIDQIKITRKKWGSICAKSQSQNCCEFWKFLIETHRQISSNVINGKYFISYTNLFRSDYMKLIGNHFIIIPLFLYDSWVINKHGTILTSSCFWNCTFILLCTHSIPEF